ncbi:lysylphosphatidylglycerol synthase domain-containing protein [Aquipuribacter nitratireducens]|uniref:Lysylphosphatidylglycerol synthase domain-containing protein n=1 Tax=Aquipuribacter nitratireducens TaxID=650104 RepID=A0ABW0GK49_9MICO
MTAGAAAPGTPAGRRGALTWLSVVVGVGVLVLGAWVVAARWDEVGPALATIGAGPSVLALGLTLVGVLATGECWRVLLAGLGGRPAPSVAHRVFYVTQAGKYVPGSLWPVLAQAALARRYGVGRATVVTASTLFLLLHTVTGVVVGVVALGPTAAGSWGRLLYPVALAGLLVLLPPVLGRLLGLLARSGRVRPGTPPSWGATARATALMALAWAAYGAATWVLLVPLSPGTADAALARTAVGAYALAWVVGFLAVAAPAGVGAREAVLVAVLQPGVGLGGALSVALVSRVVLTVADLGLAAASSGVLGRRGTGTAP